MKKITLVLLLTIAAAAAWAAGHVSYPEGYHNWPFVKSMVINKGNPLFDLVGGMHHIYANPKAMKGYQTGKFPDGSVIVFDLFEAKDADNAISAGPHKAVIVMQRNHKQFKDTGGWGFELFDPKTKKGTLDAKAQQSCFACHEPQKEKDYVFSSLQG